MNNESEYGHNQEQNTERPVSGGGSWSPSGEYRYIPEQKQTWADAGYVPSADASAVPKRYTYSAPAPAKKPKKQRRGMPAAAVIATCLVCAIVGGIAGGWGVQRFGGRIEEETRAVVETVEASEADGTTTINAASPSSSTGVTTAQVASGEALDPTTLYYDLALNQVVGITGSISYRTYFGTQTAQVSGSGFVISEDGYILTNSHVIVDAAESGGEITVLFYDGAEYTATVVGYDADNDVGVLKIDATGLTPVTIGDSDALMVGETVYVVGNALGYLEYSMTSGLVSGKDREITAYGLSGGASETIDTFQTEATINSGNSGGPVYNSRGEVVGIATASMSSSSTAESLNFAIPINTAISIATDLIGDGYVHGRPSIGVKTQTIEASAAQYYGVVPGAIVREVIEGSAAEEAGVEVGDIIVALGENEVTSSETLSSAKRDFKAGETTTLRVYRSGSYVDLTITFDEDVPTTGSAASGEQQETESGAGDYGGWSDFDNSFGRIFGSYPFG